MPTQSTGLNLKVNVSNRTVQPLDTPGNSLPPFYQDDQVLLRVFLYETKNSREIQINPEGWTLKATIGAPGGTVLASQTSFTRTNASDIGRDGWSLNGTLDLGTAQMESEIEGQSSIDRTLELELNDGTTVYTAGQARVLIYSEVNLEGTSAPLPQKFSISVHMHGATGDGATDDTAAINAAITAANTEGGGVVYFPPGTYKCNSQVVLKSNVTLLGAGSGATTLDFTGATVTNGFVYGAGSLTALPALQSNVTAGDSSITLASAPSLSKGDTYIIHDTTASSYNAARSYYYSGEFQKVSSVSGATVTNSQPAYASYSTGSARKLWKLTPIYCGIKGFKMLFKAGATGIAGIRIDHGVDVVLEDLDLHGAKYAHIRLDRCYGADIRNCSAFDNQVSDGTNYGLIVSNSQRVSVRGGRWETTRHGIAFGGADLDGSVPCREVTVTGAYITSLGSDVGLNFHGNCEHYSVSNCTLPAGLDYGGDHGVITGNVISNVGHTTGFAIAASEPVGANFKIANNTVVARKNFTNLCSYTAGSFTSRPGGVFTFTGNTVLMETYRVATYPSTTVAGLIIAFNSAQPTEDWTVLVANNYFGTKETTAGPLYGVYFAPTVKGCRSIKISGNEFNGCGIFGFINYERLDISGNTITNALQRGIRLDVVASPTFANPLAWITGNKVNKSKQAGLWINATSASRFYVQDNFLDGNALSNLGTAEDTSLYCAGAGLLSLHGNVLGDGDANQDYAFYLSGITTLALGQNENIGNLATVKLSVTTEQPFGAFGDNLVCQKGLKIKEGSNARQGVATLSSGVVTVSNTSVTANSRIFLTGQDNNVTGSLRVSARSAGVSFQITSSNAADSGAVAWEIFEPA